MSHRSLVRSIYLRGGCRFLPIHIGSAVWFVNDWYREVRLSGINLGYVSTPVSPTIYLGKITDASGLCSVMVVLESLAIETSRRGRKVLGLEAQSTLVIRPASHVCLTMRLCVDNECLKPISAGNASGVFTLSVQ